STEESSSQSSEDSTSQSTEESSSQSSEDSTSQSTEESSSQSSEDSTSQSTEESSSQSSEDSTSQSTEESSSQSSEDSTSQSTEESSSQSTEDPEQPQQPEDRTYKITISLSGGYYTGKTEMIDGVIYLKVGDKYDFGTPYRGNDYFAGFYVNGVKIAASGVWTIESDCVITVKWVAGTPIY
ncbi:MAG: hypothetical protein IJ811_03585, partial [Clostridia bacterium]|nr:hypothetical protein [Clostridia bacterium]